MVSNSKLTILVLVLLASAVLNGCAVNRATSSVDQTTDLSQLKTFYVKKYEEDKRGTDVVIRAKLEDFGLSVRESSNDVDAVVTYVDKWFWDITFYMLELTVTLRDPKTDFPLASGNSYHTSMTRKSQEGMVDEVLTNIFFSVQTQGAGNAK